MSLRRLLPVCCLALSVFVGLSACIRPHQPTINQGNLLNKKDFDRLELGMTKEQVEFLIGRPILVEPFDNSRWEYVYVAHHAYKKPIKKKMVLEFNGDKLTKIKGSIIDNQRNSNTEEEK